MSDVSPRTSIIPGNGTTKAVVYIVLGLLTGGGGTTLFKAQTTEAEITRRIDEEIARNAHYYDTGKMAQDLENIRIELRRCLATKRVR
jgi:hypothetical protein